MFTLPPKQSDLGVEQYGKSFFHQAKKNLVKFIKSIFRFQVILYIYNLENGWDMQNDYIFGLSMRLKRREISTKHVKPVTSDLLNSPASQSSER